MEIKPNVIKPFQTEVAIVCSCEDAARWVCRASKVKLATLPTQGEFQAKDPIEKRRGKNLTAVRTQRGLIFSVAT
jgi:hypothetical protein